MATLATTVEAYACSASIVQRVPPKDRPFQASKAPRARSVSRPRGTASEHSIPHGRVLADLRAHVLSYLADLESQLSSLEHPIQQLVAKGESKVDEARAWLKTGVEMLEHIRADVSSHLPELHAPDAVGGLVKALPETEYVPKLSQHLHALQSHLTSAELPHGLAESVSALKPHATVHDLIDLALAPKFVDPIAHTTGGRDTSAQAAAEIAQALRLSSDGAALIDYEELPEAWKSNPFVTQGYRFIPLSKWPSIVSSIFQLHNETFNIHTHFLPLVAWTLTLLPFSPLALPSIADSDRMQLIYTGFTLLTMFNSTVWHTMAGCADPHAVEVCARVDYVGIGWLMSTTEVTMVYYGFKGLPVSQTFWMSMLALIFVASTVFPFMDWFNDVKHRRWRIFFFVCIGFTSVAPMMHLSWLYGTVNMLTYMAPVLRSFSCYVVGLLFYAFHFPEAFFTRPTEKHWLDWLGGGSHGIWHLFVVLAISLHMHALPSLKLGITHVASA